MQLKGIIVIALILAGLGLSNIQAQSMYVKEISGTQTAYLRYLNFSDSTVVSNDHERNEEHEIKMYPNPVKDELKIDLSNSSSTDWRLYIIDFQGKILKTQTISGSDIISVDMSQFPAGTYICHFRNETEMKSFKLIKQ